MEENKNNVSEEITIVQEKPNKKANAALILGIIGTSVGGLALLLIVGCFFFGGVRSNMMNNFRYDGSNMMNNFRYDRSERIEESGRFGYDGYFCRGTRR